MIATVNNKSLRTTAIVRHIVHMRISASVKHCNAINFVVADIADYNIILGIARLQGNNFIFAGTQTFCISLLALMW